MTLKEIRKIIDNTKVYVNGKSKEIQEKLFSFGYGWDFGNNTEVSNMDKPFLFIYQDGDITYMISEITLKENKDNKIIYNVESKYCASGDKSNCKDVASVNNDFIIIKENNNYKVDSFILPD